MKTAILISAGGNGTRLWPLSTRNMPKQFVKLLGDKSLLRMTYERFINDFDLENIFISTNLRFKNLIKKEIPEIPPENIIYEPVSMDTGPAICLATSYLSNKGFDKTVYISCDHQITKVDEFIKLIKIAVQCSNKYPNSIQLIGINPTYASTALGYIEMSDPVDRIDGEVIFKVSAFKEKPDIESAKHFVNDWRYLWNASYFIYQNKHMLEQFKLYAQETYNEVLNALKYNFTEKQFEQHYLHTEKKAFDYMILEKVNDILVLPANIGWSDIGTFKVVYELSNKDTNENMATGNVCLNDVYGSLVINKSKKLIALSGIKNLVVVSTENALLITSIEQSPDIKKLIEQIPEKNK